MDPCPEPKIRSRLLFYTVIDIIGAIQSKLLYLTIHKILTEIHLYLNKSDFHSFLKVRFGSEIWI